MAASAALRAPIVATLLSAALAVACTPKARPTTADHGIATSETWLSLARYGTRIQVPPGWEFTRSDDVIAGLARDGRGGFSISGGSNKPEAKDQLANGLLSLEIELGPPRSAPRDVEVHGIVFARQDFEATVRGERAHVVVLAADAPPRSEGMLVFIGYALEGDEARREGLRASIASLRPN